MLRRVVAAPLVWVLLAAGCPIAGAAPVAHAATADSTIHACYSDSSGAIRVISAHAHCRGGESETEWNIAGATGARGARGPQGPALEGAFGAAGPTGPTGAPAPALKERPVKTERTVLPVLPVLPVLRARPAPPAQR